MILLGDLHLGVKKFNKEFFKLQIEYLDMLFSQHKGECVFQFGDIFDNRTIVDNELIIQVYDFFEKITSEYNISLYAILGNHDLYYKDGASTSLLNILNKIPNINIISYTTIIMIENMTILCVPYNENQKLDFSTIDKFDYIFGHFDIQGFLYMNNNTSKNGFDSNQFKNVNVISGHYHKNQKQNNILYIGTPYQLNWGDYDNQNGYYIMRNKSLEFVENNISPKHIKIIHQENDCFGVLGDGKYKEISIEDLINYKNHFVKLYTNNKNEMNRAIQLLPKALVCKIEEQSQNEYEETNIKLQSSPLDFLCDVVGDDIKQELMEIVSSIDTTNVPCLNS